MKTETQSIEKYLLPKDIWRLINITPAQLRYAMRKGRLIKIKWTPGKGRRLYELGEVKELFNLIE